MNYTISKGDAEGFVYLTPREMFQNKFGQQPVTIYDSEFAYYTRKIYDQIEFAFPDAKKSVVRNFINKNRNLVDNEIVYTDDEKQVMIIMRHSWDICDYAIGELDDEEDIFENVVIKKNAKFQVKITMYSMTDNPEYTKFFTKLVSRDKKKKALKRGLHIICNSPQEGIYLKSFDTMKVDISLEDNYNSDFIDVSNTILDRLNKKNDSGIVLLHSEAGCGKTSYLRYLTQNIKNKRLIYLPPDLAYRLAEPDFITFLMDIPGSILFIEDAENSLQKRELSGSSASQAVSNLLNSSDGLLGDALKLHIICTFNCSLDLIDTALQRPGRLIAEYKFEKLTSDKTKKLIEKLYGAESKHYIEYNNSEMTLAEVYNLDEKKHQSKKKYGQIGFNKK